MLPYPYESWPRLNQDEAKALGRVARVLPADLGTAARVLSDLVGAPVTARGTSLHVCGPEELARAFVDPVACVALVSVDASQRVLAELSPTLAASAVDILLGGTGEATPGAALTDGERGALAYLVARTLEALPPSSWRLAGVFTTKKAAQGFLQGQATCVWSTALRIGPEEGIGRVWIPNDVAQPNDRTKYTPRVRVELVMDGGECRLSESELRALRLRDVVVFGEDEQWSGKLRARAIGGARTTWWLNAGSRTIERIERNLEAPSGRGAVMEEKKTGAEITQRAGYDESTREVEAGLAAVGDARVVVSLELARLSLSLDEIGRLAEGEVLLAGTPVGQAASLRVGDEVIASGELVNVDGQVGLRILRLRD